MNKTGIRTASAIALTSFLTLLASCGGGGSGGDAPAASPAPVTAPAPAPVVVNTAPVANAGVAQQVLTKNTVVLDGSQSSDANGDALTYQWTMTSRPAGSAAVLLNATSAKPGFVADVAGTYVATLIVNDGKANSQAATVTVTASAANAPPVANAGVAQQVLTGNTVVLDGSQSSDANGDTLTYQWTLTSRPAASAAVLRNDTSAKPTFVADVAGTYVATLLVNDGKVNSQAATIIVTASVANAAPVANAGVPQQVLTGGAVLLDGSRSSDADGDTLTYQWTLTSRPAGSAAALTNPNSARPGFVADVAGTYVATLLVSDGKATSEAATVTVTASVANAAPVANAGVAQQVLIGGAVVLDGSQSTDADGDKLTYQWTLTSRPAGSAAVLTNANAAKPGFVADVAGTYVATLLVNDGKASSQAAMVTVTAEAGSITLLVASDSPFSPGDVSNAFPYAANASLALSNQCKGPCPIYDVAAFKLLAKGKTFTIRNLTATNLTSNSAIRPLVSGLVDGQVIRPGPPVEFYLQTPSSLGTTIDLLYAFTVEETGARFQYKVQFRSN